MIECPKCRRHISSMVENCPECGYALPKEEPVEEEPLKEDFVETPLEEPIVEPVEDPIAEPAEEAVDEPIEEPTAPLPAEEEPKKGAKRFSVWPIVVVLLLLALLVGGAYFYNDYRMRQDEERAYQLLANCQTPQAYEDFMARFPNSRYAEDVRARYEETLNLQNELKHLAMYGSRDELRRFIQKHPDSPYLQLAQSRIDSLDWAEALQVRTLEAVTFYLATHPEGYFVSPADSLRQLLEQEKAALNDSIARDSSAVAVTQ